MKFIKFCLDVAHLLASLTDLLILVSLQAILHVGGYVAKVLQLFQIYVLLAQFHFDDFGLLR